ncbi:MAG: hypothetical protein Q8R06_17380 [Polaromonas sp.]|uniref:hypothetical protein n=1 Tax=Polaromonas sp. TaxID=1869339 RepID=UPI002736DDE6|nr:hypothetical protein [Polaromonas sp.]MDP3798889.1 hypothetical protein [Polaromonas sp.]
MIAKNYMKHPDALRFQRELFSNGFHNSPRIMRLMECIFDWAPTAPTWWTAAKAKARALAKTIKQSIADLFKERRAIPTTRNPYRQMLDRMAKANPPKQINDLEGMTANTWGKLFDAQVRTLDDLADLAPDEVSEITGLPTDQACALLKAARAHWF